MRLSKPYKSDTKVEDIGSKNMSDNVNIWITSYMILYRYESLEQIK